jgi:hypothetical protein
VVASSPSGLVGNNGAMQLHEFLSQVEPTMTIDQLIGILPEGLSVTAVLVAVWIFTKSQGKYSDSLELIGSECHTHSKAQMDQFSENLKVIMESHVESTKLIGSQIGRLESAVTTLNQTIGTR